MQEKKRISINDMPKGFKLVLMLAPLLGLLIINNTLDNDFYFLYKTGEYIVQNGFPTHDFLSMHGGMRIVVQQWLSAVIFYYLYAKLGKIGVLGFIYLCYGLFCVVMYKLTMRISRHFFIAWLFAFISDIYICAMYEKTRPQAITLILIPLALYLLESFVQTKKWVYLAFLPVISLLLINLHAAMWAMLFVFAAPYVVAALPVKIGKIRQEPCCSFVKLLLCGAVCFAFGFLNPYGWAAMTYIFSSFGYSEINALIIEMLSPTITSSWGFVLFTIFGVLAAVAAFAKKRSFTTRFVLLFAGTVLMALMNTKSIAYFFVGGMPAFTYMLKDTEIYLTVDSGTRTPKEKKKLLIMGVALVAMLGVLVATLFMQSGSDNTTAAKPVKSDYEMLDEITAILDKENPDDIILYTGFDYGQYLEFKGYHPYIDGRAELFLKDNNGEYDYLKEYVNLSNGTLYYKDFTDKYHFNYLVVDSNTPYFNTALQHDDDYELLYKSKKINLYHLKQQGDSSTNG